MQTTYAAQSLQSCPTMCDLINGSLAGSPVPGILQARVLEWVAISFSKPTYTYLKKKKKKKLLMCWFKIPLCLLCIPKCEYI